MEYMKLGCNWGSGKPDFYDMIKEKSIIICSNNNGFQKGTYVAVCSGHKVIAIAKLLEAPYPSTDNLLLKNDFNEYEIEFSKTNKIAKAKFYELSEEDRFSYKLQQGICQINNEEIIKKMDKTINKIESQLKMEFEMNKIVEILKSKKNIILQGAPGTGKTYNTAALAIEIIEGSLLKYKDHAEIMKRYDELIKEGQIQFTTFHQSMDYEDFVEGIKPKLVEDETSGSKMVSYEIENGIFKRICDDGISFFEKSYNLFLEYVKKECSNSEDEKFALKTESERSSFYICVNSNNVFTYYTGDAKEYRGSLTKENCIKSLLKTYLNNDEHYYRALIKEIKNKFPFRDITDSSVPKVLIIDEINRGNVSKIFGELITLLEADKRKLVGEDAKNQDLINNQHTISVTLPYSKETFTVPSNLYIIGTMNTTDRSTGTLDYALRRRFAFVTLNSTYDEEKKQCEEINNYYHNNTELCDKANALFSYVYDFIKNHKADPEMDIKDLMVGHSYFMASSEENLNMKFEYEVKPLIDEYIKDGIISSSMSDFVNDLNNN